MTRTYSFGASLTLALVLSACGGSKPEPEAGPQEPTIQFPEWVNKGSGAFGKDGKKAFYGVGMASGIKNHSLAMTTADNRARAEISKVFEVYSASLMKDYMASTTAGDMSASSEEQHVEQAIKTFSANTLSGVVIVEHWFHPDGTVYSLAKLDLEAMKDLTAKSKELDPKVRDYVRKNAALSFDALEAQENKSAGNATPPASDPPPAVAEQPKTGTCTATLKVVQLGRSGASCYIDEKITGANGTMTYPCAGGRAEATFGTYVFQGFVTDGKADLLLATDLDFTDGCKWKSRQRISGAMTAPELVFDYEEAPAPGQKGCAAACTAKAGVKVTR